MTHLALGLFRSSFADSSIFSGFATSLKPYLASGVPHVVPEAFSGISNVLILHMKPHKQIQKQTGYHVGFSGRVIKDILNVLIMMKLLFISFYILDIPIQITRLGLGGARACWEVKPPGRVTSPWEVNPPRGLTSLGLNPLGV